MARRNPRTSVEVRIEAEFFCGQSSGRGFVEDMSEDGFFVRSSLLPAEGSDAIVTLKLERRRIAVKGTVAWNSAGGSGKRVGFGVALVDPPPLYLQLVDNALDDAQRRRTRGPL